MGCSVLQSPTRDESIHNARLTLPSLVINTAKVLFINYDFARGGGVVTIKHNLLSIQELTVDEGVKKIIKNTGLLLAQGLNIKTTLNKSFGRHWKPVQPIDNQKLTLAVKDLLELSSCNNQDILTAINSRLPESYIILEKEII